MPATKEVLQCRMVPMLSEQQKPTLTIYYYEPLPLTGKKCNDCDNGQVKIGKGVANCPSCGGTGVNQRRK